MGDFAHDSGRGLYLPKSASASGKRKAPPNPDRAPPLDPFWIHELNRLGERVGRRYRWHWMEDMRIWGIQLYLGGDKWQTVHAHYDEDSQWKGNWYPYLPPSRQALEEFCKTDLKIRYGTGDVEKDKALRDKDVKEAEEAKKKRNHERAIEMIGRAVTGDDPKRFVRLVDHEIAHSGDATTPSGIRFQEYFTGFGPGKKGKKKKGKKKR